MNGVDVKKYSHLGTVTPDHVIRIKPYPLIINLASSDDINTFRIKAKKAID